MQSTATQTCRGCLRNFSGRGGLMSHLRQATFQGCKQVLHEVEDSEGLPGVDETAPHANHEHDDDESEGPEAFGGDHFGADYGPEDFPGFGWEEEDDGMDVEVDGAGEEEEEDDEGWQQDEDDGDDERVERHWEAPLPEGQGATAPMNIDADEDGAEHHGVRGAGRAAVEDSIRQEVVKDHFPLASAGAPVAGNRDGGPEHSLEDAQNAQPSEPTNPYAPFASRLNWEVARWAKLLGPGSNAMSELLKIPGIQDSLGLSYKNSRELNSIIDKELPARRPRFQRAEMDVDGEVFDVYYRDILECVRALFSDKAFAPYLVFAPERHYTDESRQTRLYHDIHTGKWWWTTQEKLEAHKPGATIIPIIVSSDKTQVTLFGGKTMYPVYLTIGNIPKELRRKVSQSAQILLAYLPASRLEHVTNIAARRRMLANIFHTALRRILQPLREAGLDGLPMASGDGVVRRVHPILAAHVGDYIEHIAVVGCKMGECPRCQVPNSLLGDPDHDFPWRNLTGILEALATYDTNPQQFLRACRDAGVKPIAHPYWEDLPFVNIFTAIPPDILHQLYQGLIKHLISWIKTAFSEDEINARCRRLPPNHHLRHFWKGITSLSRPTGREHSDIARILLGLIIDMPLPGGQSPIRLVKATRALLDFLYLAQYPVHSSETLALLQDSLERFHDNKQVFVDLGVREDWKLPKLHFVSHYVALIKALGTTDNFNTEYTERLHIDLAKNAYRATNHKNELPQMTLWLERREKILQHEKHVRWCLDGCPPLVVNKPLFPPPPRARIHMAGTPSRRAVPLSELQTKYSAPFFKDALARYMIQHAYPTLTQAQIEERASDLDMPFRSLPVYHKAKFWLGDKAHHRLMSDEWDTVHSRAAWHDKLGREIPGRFDTVLVNQGTGQYIGVEGYCVAQVKVIFTLSRQVAAKLFPPGSPPPPQYFAYVEWFTAFSQDPEPHHLFYRIKRSLDNNQRLASVIPLKAIRRSIHLFPSFGRVAPREWTSSNVLDQCPVFFVNDFTDRHTYHTVV